MIPKIKQYLVQNFESVFVLTVLVSVGILNYLIPYKLAFLNFYYIPVFLASVLLGIRRTILGALLCAAWVLVFVTLSPESFFFEQTRLNLYLNVIAWACFLILAGTMLSRFHHEKKQLFTREKNLRERLSTHLAVAEDLGSELDFNTLFHLIVQKLTDAMKAERSSLYIIDDEKKEVWTKVAEQVEPIRLPFGQGVCGRVAQTGEIINVEDAWELPYFSRQFDIRNDFRTRSMLCMPIHNRTGKRIGIIQVINKTDGTRFNKADESLLQGLISQVAIALENSFLMDEVEASFESSIRTLSATVDAKHHLTHGHSQRVTAYSLLIARQMGLSQGDLLVLEYAALLHDIGKIAVPDKVLLKNGRFTDEERMEMNIHPVKTREILKQFRFPAALREVPVIAGYHHEKYNGKGYPEGLAGEDLPLGSRIMAVADVFDALTSPRDYPKYDKDEVMSHQAMPLERAVKILESERDEHFDSRVVDAFMAVLPQALDQFRGEHFSESYIAAYTPAFSR
ncbi:MAG: GAF domain-containing protein [Desulfotignum sp.]|nr:GAF domain-containing protein [Desulfotignum sp.]MCF8089889.1 GAF domain-containing protein [Desulfotignum sp.]MCF8137551.1 GAF domain-containing protein [Desulfotignum sp.]